MVIFMNICMVLITAISSALALGDCSNQQLISVMNCENSQQADKQITSAVRAAIDPISKCARKITISTTNGIVTLRGTIANAKDKDAVIQKAKNVQCVKRVDAYLSIDPNC